jgi:hypothetical protein
MGSVSVSVVMVYGTPFTESHKSQKTPCEYAAAAGNELVIMWDSRHMLVGGL